MILIGFVTWAARKNPKNLVYAICFKRQKTEQPSFCCSFPYRDWAGKQNYVPWTWGTYKNIRTKFTDNCQSESIKNLCDLEMF